MLSLWGWGLQWFLLETRTAAKNTASKCQHVKWKSSGSFLGWEIFSIQSILRNSVDLFLFWGGIVTIVANASKWILFNICFYLIVYWFLILFLFYFPGALLGGFARQLALRDGRISCAEVFTFYIFSVFHVLRYSHISVFDSISGMLPWPVGLLHWNGQPSWSCHSHLGGNSSKPFFYIFSFNSQWVSESVIVSDLEIAIASPNFASMFVSYPIKSWLQGSVVVFSSWPNWTSEDMTSADYCMETPMLFAFVLQIVRWVSWHKDIYRLASWHKVISID